MWIIILPLYCAFNIPNNITWNFYITKQVMNLQNTRSFRNPTYYRQLLWYFIQWSRHSSRRQQVQCTCWKISCYIGGDQVTCFVMHKLHLMLLFYLPSGVSLFHLSTFLFHQYLQFQFATFSFTWIIHS